MLINFYFILIIVFFFLSFFLSFFFFFFINQDNIIKPNIETSEIDQFSSPTNCNSILYGNKNVTKINSYEYRIINLNDLKNKNNKYKNGNNIYNNIVLLIIIIININKFHNKISNYIYFILMIKNEVNITIMLCLRKKIKN